MASACLFNPLTPLPPSWSSLTPWGAILPPTKKSVHMSFLLPATFGFPNPDTCALLSHKHPSSFCPKGKQSMSI